jgi:predicted amidophosphoribosyltransferase
VLDLKLRGFASAAEPLVEAMANEVWRRGLVGLRLTWVPASRKDNRRRGYDHAEVLARGLGARIGLPVVPLLTRSRQVLDQTGLGAVERRRNLERAFEASTCRHPVVIVDDVVTTGATLAACGTALRRAGVPSVEAVVASAA